MSLPATQIRPNAGQRGYGWRWQKASKTFLLSNPLCRLCTDVGRTTAATLVDHVDAHRGDQAKFWDKTNWQPLCKLCHDTVKQRQEKSGIVIGCGVDGLPLDPNHLWNKPKEDLT